MPEQDNHDKQPLLSEYDNKANVAEPTVSSPDVRIELSNSPHDITLFEAAQRIPALHYAALSNQDVIIKYLIDRGATVDLEAGDLKATALHWAARYMVFNDNVV
ncbi:unnamed protein product [Umbelopsis ramanniana]